MGSIKLHLFFILFLQTMCKSSFALDYFPKGYFDSVDATKVTWAHGVNSKDLLDANIKDASVKMLEADLVIGTLEGSANNATPIVIMAHPPANISNLSFEMFLEKVIEYNKNHTLKERKGIKLDFKELAAAQKALPLIKQKRDQNAELVQFPIWINADILPGPVNASENKVNGTQLISLQKSNSPNSTLSIGWTTRFGKQDDGELIRNGSYTKANMEAMAKLIKDEFPTGENSTVEITFPLRAGLALNNVSNVKYLLDESGINFASPSVTLWEGADDPPLNLTKLDEFYKEINSSRVFVDLPYSLGTSAGWKAESESNIVFLTLLPVIAGYFCSNLG